MINLWPIFKRAEKGKYWWKTAQQIKIKRCLTWAFDFYNHKGLFN